LRFAVHGPGSPVASPRSHGVPRRDVDGRVHVSVGGVSAGGAPEDGLALARLRVHLPARRAALARERGIDPFHPAGSLLLQAAYQQSPARPQDFPVKSGLGTNVPTRVLPGALGRACHIHDSEVFDPDYVEPPGDVGTGLLSPVLPSVGLTGAYGGDRMLNPHAAVRPAPRPGQFPLQPLSALALLCGQAGGVKQLTGRQCRGDRYASVDADKLAVARCLDRRRDGSKSDVPSTCAVHGYPVGLHAHRNWAGPAESDPAGLRDTNLADVAGQAAYFARLHGDDPESLVSVDLTPGRSPGGVLRIKERSHRLSEIPQGLLLHHLAARTQPVMLGTGCGELLTLLQVPWCAPSSRSPLLVLLNGHVPGKPSVRAVAPQHRLLARRGNHAVTGHANTLAKVTDNSGEVKRRHFRGPRSWISTPRSR
jgi:hypothetical protein